MFHPMTGKLHTQHTTVFTTPVTFYACVTHCTVLYFSILQTLRHFYVGLSLEDEDEDIFVSG